MKYLIFTLIALLTACGPSGDKSGPNTTTNPVVNSQILMSYTSVTGTHQPRVTYFEHDNNLFLKILFMNEVVNVTSAGAFRQSALGSALIGNLFTNGELGKELFLKFTLALGTSETVEYSLDLNTVGTGFTGHETLKIGASPETKIKVNFMENQ